MCNVNLRLNTYLARGGIVRFDNGLVQLNLLLNCESPRLHIDSYLPYEGKVVLKNKMTERMSVRIPLWVDRNAVRFQVHGKETATRWLGRQRQVGALRSQDAIIITFPMAATIDKHTERTYNTTLRVVS